MIIDVDGKSDRCSREEDINFDFIGYKIEGKIIHRHESGAMVNDVTIKLELVDASGTVLDSTISHNKDSGKYYFSGVATGKYVVRIGKESLPAYSFQQTEHNVVVTNNCVHIEDFIILGFDIDGDVLFEDVTGGMLGIANWPISIEYGTIEKVIKTDARGHFRFSNMSQGNYIIRTSKTVAYDDLLMSTEECQVKVRNGKSDQCRIIINGCKMHGLIGHTENGISNAEVKIVQGKSEFTVKSDTLGEYKSPLLKAGEVVITGVAHGDFIFNPVSFIIRSPLDTLPTLRPDRIRVEGIVEITKNEHKLSVTCKSSEEKVFSHVHENSFSIFLQRGKYECYITTDGLDTVYFTTVSLTIDPKELRPSVKKIVFLYSTVSISGEILCSEECSSDDDVYVEIFFQDTLMKLSSTKVANSKFQFNEVKPGNYKIIATKKNACWESNLINLEVGNNDISGLQIIQKGRVVLVDTDNPTTLKLNNGQVFHLEEGKNEICVEGNSELTFSSESCFIFVFDPKFNPKISNTLEMRTVGQKITGEIVALEVIDDMILNVNDKTVDVMLQSEKTHKFEHSAPINQEMLFRPSSQDFFFEPSFIALNVKADLCSQKLTFRAKKGVYVSGHVEPPIKDVLIDVRDFTRVKTDIMGTFRIGPVPSNHASSLDFSATKEGYYFTKKSGEIGHFIAHKLATIRVEVKTKLNEPLFALVSISGGSSYRNNSHTANGEVTFLSMHPGDYFVKPFLKEYLFEPRSTMLTISEQTTDNVNIAPKVSFIGERTSYTG